jgi:hypothetical protein
MDHRVTDRHSDLERLARTEMRAVISRSAPPRDRQSARDAPRVCFHLGEQRIALSQQLVQVLSLFTLNDCVEFAS